MLLLQRLTVTEKHAVEAASTGGLLCMRGDCPALYLSIIAGISCEKETVESPTAIMHRSLNEVT